MNGPRLGNIPTPLEGVDLVADVVNQVVSTPPRVLGNALSAAGGMCKNIEGDLARPREYSEIPPPPQVLVEPAISGVGHIVDGVLGTAKGAAEGVLATFEGVRREVTTFIRR